MCFLQSVSQPLVGIAWHVVEEQGLSWYTGKFYSERLVTCLANNDRHAVWCQATGLQDIAAERRVFCLYHDRTVKHCSKRSSELAGLGQHVGEWDHVQAAPLVARFRVNHQSGKAPITKDHPGAGHPAPAGLCAGRGFADVKGHQALGELTFGVHRSLTLTSREENPSHLLALPDRRDKITIGRLLHLGLREPNCFTTVLG